MRVTSYIRMKKDNFDKVTRSVDNEIEGTIDDFGESIVQDIRNSMRLHNSPSPVGEPPAIVTGNLLRSVKKEKARNILGRFAKSKDAVGISITMGGAKAPYANILEDEDGLNRPSLKPALERATERADVYFKGIKVR